MSRGFDLGKLFGGPGQGDGPIGLLLNPLAGVAILGGGAALAGGSDAGVDAATAGVFTDVGGAAARGGAGIFAHIFEMAGSTDWIFDYILYRDFTDRRGFGGFAGMGAQATEKLKIVLDATAAHGFFLTMLEEYKDKPGVSPLLKEYKALGLNLPSQELLKKVHRKLLEYLHPDKNPGIPEGLISALNSGRDALQNDLTRAAYQTELHYDRPGIEKIFDAILKKKTHWKEFYENAAHAAETGAPKLALAGSAAATGVAGAATKAGSWFSKQHCATQTGIVFAGVAVAALGVYWIAHTLETRRKKHSPLLETPPASHTERLQAAAQNTAADAARTPSH